MLDKIKRFFSKELEIIDQQTEQQKLQSACAALLIEVSKADFEQTEDERVKVKALLARTFDLSDAQLNELITQCEQNSDDTTSVYPFTSLIKEHYDYDQRVNLVKLMWKVAYADGNLDKFEDEVIRKVADLIYVRHSDFIQAKLSEAQKH
jgi:uncharacterized tellurite resistance protein B-like protein